MSPTIEARISWGDYRTEPPLPEAILLPEPLPEELGEDGKPKRTERPLVDWVRSPKDRIVVLPVKDGRGGPIVVPESAAEQRRGGGLVLETHSRLFSYTTPDGKTERVRALTVFLVNRRATVHRFYADVSYAFQARLELVCETGFRPRRDLSGYRAQDWDLRIADLHYRDMREWAVGRNAAAGWDATEELRSGVTRVWTDPLPSAEVERVAPNEDADFKARVTFGMESAGAVGRGGWRWTSSGPGRPACPLRNLDRCRAQQARRAARHGVAKPASGSSPRWRRRKAGSRTASIFWRATRKARTAFRFMNLAVAMAARRRDRRRDRRSERARRTAMAAVPACLRAAQYGRA